VTVAQLIPNAFAAAFSSSSSAKVALAYPTVLARFAIGQVREGCRVDVVRSEKEAINGRPPATFALVLRHPLLTPAVGVSRQPLKRRWGSTTPFVRSPAAWKNMFMSRADEPSIGKVENSCFFARTGSR
jgi:hypothetical protein